MLCGVNGALALCPVEKQNRRSKYNRRMPVILFQGRQQHKRNVWFGPWLHENQRCIAEHEYRNQ